jgi:hypothetical protein
MADKQPSYPPNDPFPIEIVVYVIIVIVLANLVFVFVSLIGGFIVALLGAFFGAAASNVLGKQ